MDENVGTRVGGSMFEIDLFEKDMKEMKPAHGYIKRGWLEFKSKRFHNDFNDLQKEKMRGFLNVEKTPQSMQETRRKLCEHRAEHGKWIIFEFKKFKLITNAFLSGKEGINTFFTW